MNSTSVLARLQEGYRLQGSGHFEDAERIFRGILALQPDNGHALNLLGALCINTGRPKDALEVMQRAVRESPDDPDTQANFALALKDTGNFEQSAQAFRNSLRLRPDHPVTLNNLGNVLAVLQQTDAAVAAFRAALRLVPDYPECLSNLAAALLALRQYAQALQAVDRALVLRPGVAEALNTRGEILVKVHRYEDAIASYRAAVSQRPQYDAAWINLSAALKDTGDVRETRQILEAVVARDATNPRALDNLGTLLEQIGMADEAAAYFRQAIAASSTYASAYYQLAHLDAGLLTAADVAEIQTQLADSRRPDDERSLLAFGLACVFEFRGVVDDHFHHLMLGHSLKGRAARYDHARVARYHESMKRVFAAPAAIAARPPVPRPSPCPVFVLGMPRSGTSLTEQILASHPDVRGAGELGLMEETVERAGRMCGGGFPDGFAALDAAQRQALGEHYWSRLVQRAGSARYIVDKTPMNFQYIGFILSILPDARIVHCMRDPVDNCWSIYKLPFEGQHSYAHNLRSLGDYYRLHADLMSHWTAVAGSRMLAVHYEEMVAETDVQIKRLLEFLDLPDHDALRTFHKTERIVKTPSASQVRRPIYRTSLDAWRPYQAHLEPLLEALRQPDRAG